MSTEIIMEKVAETSVIENVTSKVSEAVCDFAEDHPVATTAIVAIGGVCTFMQAFALGKKAVSRGKDAADYTKQKMAEKKAAKEEKAEGAAATVDGEPVEAEVVEEGKEEKK